VAELSVERIAKEFEQELEGSLANYHAALTALATRRGGDPDLDEFLAVQKTGQDYFNGAEQFVYRLNLTDAPDNGGYITGLAETCHTILDSYLDYRSTLSDYATRLGVELPVPAMGANASLQRIVKKYLPKDAKVMAIRFRNAKLPTRGFDVKPIRNRMKVNWPAVLGVLALVALAVLSILFPNPTHWQQFVWRSCLSLGISGCATAVAGVVNLKLQSTGPGTKMKITATGAVAILIIFYFANPSFV
jgi:uncharacterized integral membrane protein